MPKIQRFEELPQWITSSDRAAYHPASNTIYIRNDQGLMTLLHEYGHWLGCLLNCNRIHKWLDN